MTDAVEEEMQRRIALALKSPTRAVAEHDENEGSPVRRSPRTPRSTTPRALTPRATTPSNMSPYSRTPFKVDRAAAAAMRSSPRLQRSASKIIAKAAMSLVAMSPALRGKQRLLSSKSVPALPLGPRSASATPRRAAAEPQAYWHTTVDASVVASVSKDELQRQELIFELMSTEQAYVKDLNTLVNLFMRPMNRMEIFTTGELRAIFANVEQLFDMHASILSDFVELQAESMCISHVGAVLQKRMSRFSDYAHYCGNLRRAHAVLSQKTAKHAEFAHFLEECLDNVECRRLGITDFLDEPRRRLSKYSLLLAGIVKRTPEDHPDSAAIREANEQFGEVMRYIDEQSGRIENQFRTQEIKEHLDYREDPMEIVAPSREVLYESRLRYGPQKNGKEVLVVLMDTCVLVLREKVKEDGMLRLKLFKPAMPIKSLSFGDVVEGGAVSIPAAAMDTTLRMSCAGKHHFFSCGSAVTKRDWLAVLSKLARE